MRLLYGPSYEPTVNGLRWTAFIPFMAGMTGLFGVQRLLPLGLKKALTRILNVALLPVLAKYFAEQGAASAVLLAEAAVAAALAAVVDHEGIPLIGRPAARRPRAGGRRRLDRRLRPAAARGLALSVTATTAACRLRRYFLRRARRPAGNVDCFFVAAQGRHAKNRTYR